MARVDWGQLPSELREWAEATLGARVAKAESQAGGFSPGAACRLRLEDGGRAFCKAVSASANPQSPGMHRREAQIAAALPPDVPAPRFIASYDDGEWVGLLFADVDGRPPAQPWRADELDHVLGAVAVLHDRLTPSPLSSAPAIADMHAANFTGWRSLAATSGASASPLPGGRPVQDPWSMRHLDRLAELEAAWPEAAAGNTLLHNDLRADNMLITADGVRFVDWPHACVGAAWFDLAAFAPSVVMDGGPEPERLMARVPSAAAADPDAVTAVVAAVAGYFTYQATLPPPPGLPAIREFQEAQGAPARAWLQRLTGWK
jgi:hypothetical protein